MQPSNVGSWSSSPYVKGCPSYRTNWGGFYAVFRLTFSFFYLWTSYSVVFLLLLKHISLCMTNISKIFEGYSNFYSNGQASPPASRQATLERKVNWQKVQGASQLIKHNMAIMMPSLKEKEIAKFKSIHWKRRTFSGWLWAQAMAMGMATVSGNLC